VTHAHSDHARAGSGSYLAADEGVAILRHRLGDEADVATLPYGERRTIGGVTVSFHPAGHIRGSAQVRVEHRGEVWVVTGDYKREADPTCTPFEVVPCHTLITEATFAFPVYRWEPPAVVVGDIVAWYEACLEDGRTANLYSYTLGKAQRLLAELAPYLEGPAWVHGAVEPINELYRRDGIALGETRRVSELAARQRLTGALVIAPPSAATPGWMRHFTEPDTAFASGWMRLRGTRRRRSLDRGFAISDHADWSGLLRTVAESGASRVLATHGDSHALVRLLNERGVQASALETPFTREEEE
jgi:putative mRNA 3-end processing factor